MVGGEPWAAGHVALTDAQPSIVGRAFHPQRLNGEVLQDSRTSDLIFDVPTLVSYVTRAITLEPGDLILTGTPEGVGVFRDPKITLVAGDVVEIEVEGIGVLRNEVSGS